MAKKRYNLMDTMEDINNFIQNPKHAVSQFTEQNNDGANRLDGINGQDSQNEVPESKSGVGEYNPTMPDVKYKRNITLSEEMLWRLNYIKDRKNKNRAKGDKFTTIDQLMFEMVQFALDEKYSVTKKKFLESKEDEEGLEF